jgi:hypothetical protein
LEKHLVVSNSVRTFESTKKHKVFIHNQNQIKMITSALINGTWINVNNVKFNTTSAVVWCAVGEAFTTTEGFMVKSTLLKEITKA